MDICTCGRFRYTIRPDGTATIVGYIGDCPDSLMKVPDELDGHPVTAIGDMFCADQELAFTLILPGGLTSIGEDAFRNCLLTASVVRGSYAEEWLLTRGVHSLGKLISTDASGCALTTVVQDDGTLALTGCKTGSDTLSIPAALCGRPITALPENVFRNCLHLTSVTLPSSITTIGGDPFACMMELTDIIVNRSCWVGQWVYKQFCNSPGTHPVTSTFTYGDFLCNLLNDGTVEIASYTGPTDAPFSVTIPAEVQGHRVSTIGGWLFEDAVNLTSIAIPEGIAFIGCGAFCSCKALTSVRLPDTLVYLGEDAFLGCTALAEIHLPDRLVHLGDGAFISCTALTSIHLPASLRTLSEATFMGCKSLNSVDLPGSLERIEYGAFANCESLSSITIPASVRRIHSDAFRDCPATIIRGSHPDPDGSCDDDDPLVRELKGRTMEEVTQLIARTPFYPGIDRDGSDNEDS